MSGNPGNSVQLTIYTILFVISGLALALLCRYTYKTRSYKFYKDLIAGMTIMNFSYFMLVITISFFISYLNGGKQEEWKYIATYEIFNVIYLLPISTLLYC